MPTPPCSAALPNVELPFLVVGQDAQGRPLGLFRVGVVNMPPHSSPMTREVTGVITDGQMHVVIDPQGRLPGYLLEITFRPQVQTTP